MEPVLFDPIEGKYTPLRNVQKPLPVIDENWDKDQIAEVELILESKSGSTETKQALIVAFRAWLRNHERIIQNYHILAKRTKILAQAQQKLMRKLIRIPGIVKPESADELTPEEIEDIISDVKEERRHKLKIAAGISKLFLFGKILLETALALPFVHNGMSAMELDWNPMTGTCAVLFAATLGLMPQLLFRLWYQLFQGLCKPVRAETQGHSLVSKPIPGIMTQQINDITSAHSRSDEMHLGGKAVLLVLLSVGLAVAGYTWWYVDSYTFAQRLNPEIAPGMALVTTIVLFMMGFLLAVKDEHTAHDMHKLDEIEVSMRKLIEEEYADIQQAYEMEDKVDTVKSCFGWLLDACKSHKARIMALDLHDVSSVQHVLTEMRQES